MSITFSEAATKMRNPAALGVFCHALMSMEESELVDRVLVPRIGVVSGAGIVNGF